MNKGLYGFPKRPKLPLPTNYSAPQGLYGGLWLPREDVIILNRKNAGQLIALNPYTLHVDGPRFATGASTEMTQSSAYDPYEQRLATAAYGNGSGTVTQIWNLSTRTRVSPATATGPYGICFAHSSRSFYVTLVGGSANSIAIIAPDDSVSSLTVGSLPVGIGYVPSTDRVYVGNRSSNSISVVNPNTNTVVNTIASLAGADLPQYIHGDGKVWCTGTAANILKIIDPASETITSTPTAPGNNSRGCGYIDSIGEVWIPTVSNVIARYDLAGTQLGTFSTSIALRGPVYHPPTDKVFFINDDDQYVGLVDPHTKSISFYALDA